MSESKVGTVSLAQAPATNIGPFYTAPAGEVMRLFVRNTGPGLAILAYASSVVNGAGTLTGASDRFLLSPGLDVVFVLQPRQQVYAVGIGAGGQLSYHVSVALPFSPGAV